MKTFSYACRLFAIFSLTGCGLKGPLFPPADKRAAADQTG